MLCRSKSVLNGGNTAIDKSMRKKILDSKSMTSLLTVLAGDE